MFRRAAWFLVLLVVSGALALAQSRARTDAPPLTILVSFDGWRC